MSQEPDASLEFLAAAQAEGHRDGACVVIVRTREEFAHWLRTPAPGVGWLQVEGLLGDQEVWAMAAQGAATPALDVILSDPAADFSGLYRLVDVRIVREVRVTMPAAPGFMKALRLAAALQLPVLLLPGQPSAEVLAELTEAAHFYLRDPMVETPVEFFHSLLAAFRGMGDGTLWRFLEEDPAIFSRRDAAGRALHAPDFVETHLARLLEDGAECVACRWQPVCAGYFKSPDPTYACAGVKQLFAMLEAAAEEIGRDLASQETPSAP
ncbi:MAG TPA: hypothetical protein VK961_27430 [Chthoniobacter sp.]|nr:hypothetical protein [Chthoniobacter sp.]